MMLEINVAIFLIVATLLSIKCLKRYGVGEKYCWLQLIISFISLYFSETPTSYFGLVVAILLLFIYLKHDEKTLKVLLEKSGIKFSIATLPNLVFVIDNIKNIVDGIFALIIILVIVIIVIIIIVLLVFYIFLIIKFIIHRYKN